MVNQKLLALALAALAPLSAVARQFLVVNSCPGPIDLYVNGEEQGTIQVSGSTTLLQDPGWSGFIYTSSFGGAADATGTTRAGFYGTNNWYYIVIDPNGFNTAVSIFVNQTAQDGYCLTDSCLSGTCTTAFTTPPSHIIGKPPGPPNPPFYECDFDSLQYTVVFCPANPGSPGGTPPPINPPPITPPPSPISYSLHPNGNADKCLDVRGAVYENGTPVQIYDCNGTGAQRWVLTKGETKVQVEGTEFCLDAGSTPGNGVQMKIWQCYDNLAAQDWWYTDDNRIALTNQGLCLDLPDGETWNTNVAQTWQCTDGNTNQIWIEENDVVPSSNLVLIPVSDN